MAIVSFSRSSSNTWIFSLKALLLSTGVLSTAFAFKISVPLMREFLFSALPQIWTSLLSWMTPPYLYFVINGIIITIAAASKFQQQQVDDNPETEPEKIATAVRTSYVVPAGYEAMVLKNPADIRPDFQVAAATAYGEPEARVCDEKVKETEEEEDFVISRSDWEPRRRDSTEHSISTEKPPVSVRFGHKKSVKASPDQGSRALGVAKPKRHETLENTWKTITEGRPMPLTRHLKKSDTWETHGRHRSDDHPKPVMKKSETAKDRNTTASSSPSPSPGSGKLLRKESSLSQDELNRRVEAFIKKFNEEMRLQRQESMKHYMEMVNRGSH